VPQKAAASPAEARAVEPDANPGVRSVVEAARTGRYPERLTPMVMPKPFDRKTYEANPQAYLDVVEPGRVWQDAKEGPPIEAVGATQLKMKLKEKVALAVKTPPDAPATFTSFDLGAFQNGLTTITVQADKEGVARATFTATPGTMGDVNILAASPLTQGQASFKITVRPE
jgi:hypothetical protein